MTETQAARPKLRSLQWQGRAWPLCPLGTVDSYHAVCSQSHFPSPMWETRDSSASRALDNHGPQRIRCRCLSPLRNRKKQNPCAGRCVPVRQQKGAFHRPQLFPTTAESLSPVSPSTQALASSLPHLHAFNTVGPADVPTAWLRETARSLGLQGARMNTVGQSPRSRGGGSAGGQC